ncbi:HTH_48 domain-containing protein [Trichonephila clavipes]|nr:HTH_48 domain-containing protein [Trichonephila clavipes]
MYAAIEIPLKCEVRGVIRFLWAKNLSTADIPRELCAVYGSNIISEGVVRQWEHFPNISLAVLYETVTGKLGYRKFCAHGYPQNQSNGRCLRISFLVPHGWGGLFLNRIVTGDDTWVAHVNVEQNNSLWYGVIPVLQPG